MPKSSEHSEIMDSITLMDGRTLECYPKPEVPQPKYRWRVPPEVIQANEDLFIANAHTLMRNSDLTFSDSRLFLSPLGYHTSIGPTVWPSLGILLEWWEYSGDYSIDEDGRHIFYISGNPMTGSSGCGSVDSDGVVHLARLRHGLIDTVRSFNRVCNRYLEAQQKFQALSLREVLDRLP